MFSDILINYVKSYYFTTTTTATIFTFHLTRPLYFIPFKWCRSTFYRQDSRSCHSTNSTEDRKLY